MRDKQTTYRIMSSIKSKGTQPEQILGRNMWKLGLRYRKHFKIKGKPDFVFTKKKIAVFCDGDFWHGNNWKIRGMRNRQEELKKYSPFWKEKILRNIKRDIDVNAILRKEGWMIMRFWESDIREAPEKCAQKVLGKYKQQKR
jgi:DNA mismatch endonuclease, patch repair protein